MESAMATVIPSPAARLEQKTAARTEDAVKVYGKGQTEVRALDGVTVGFAAGRYTAVMGPSGSGKSTLLHCVAGLDSLTSGRAFIGDEDLSTLDDQRLTILRRDRVGFVFQAFNLVPTISAAKNMTLPLLLAGRKGDQAWIGKVIDITGLGDRLERYAISCCYFVRVWVCFWTERGCICPVYLCFLSVLSSSTKFYLSIF